VEVVGLITSPAEGRDDEEKEKEKRNTGVREL
jgi:hypothetical protein